MKWSKLKILGKNRTILGISLFLTVIPLLYKIQEFIESIINSAVYPPVHFNSPFSWGILFFAAICFNLGIFLFRLFCPDLIFKYDNYRDYQNSGKNIFQFHDYLNNLINLKNFFSEEEVDKWETAGDIPTQAKIIRTFRYSEKLNQYLDYQRSYNSLLKEKADWFEGYKRMPTDPELRFVNLWHTVFKAIDKNNGLMRWLITIFYGAGILLLLFLALQNIVFVIKHII